jgi:aspartate aminotransferase
MAGEFDRRRRVIVEGLNRIPGLRCPLPQGAFYAFPDVSGLFGRRWNGQPLRGSADVTTFLLEAARVAVVPGADFGSDRHLRISYACGLEQIEEGLTRIESACRSLA